MHAMDLWMLRKSSGENRKKDIKALRFDYITFAVKSMSASHLKPPFTSSVRDKHAGEEKKDFTLYFSTHISPKIRD